jgi:hypothetical protein
MLFLILNKKKFDTIVVPSFSWNFTLFTFSVLLSVGSISNYAKFSSIT